jgi:tRNA dimethylallyltransferase
VLGPTASGKSEVALRFAEEIGAEIISVDSMQIYRRMNIGTAKPDLEERARVRHHGIDLVEPSDSFSVADFQALGRAVLTESEAPVVIAGGSGLHFRALVDPMRFRPHDANVRAQIEEFSHQESVERLLALDAEAGRNLDLANPRRVTRALEIAVLTGETPTARASGPEQERLSKYEPLFDFKAVALDPDRGLPGRVDQRLSEMLDRPAGCRLQGVAAGGGRRGDYGGGNGGGSQSNAGSRQTSTDLLPSGSSFGLVTVV